MSGAGSGPSGRNALGGGSLLLGANLLEVGLPVLRNVALARLITPDQFGLAISLAVVLGMIEVLTDIGLPQFAVARNRERSADDVLATLQSLALIRGAILAALLLAASPWVARLIGVVDHTGIYALLAAVALLRGLAHLGTKAAMRDYVFWREAVVVATGQIVLLGATVAVASVTRRFDCMLWGMLAAAAAEAGLSHLLSPRPYRLGWDAATVAQARGFGGPLVANGVVTSMGMGDRLVVGWALGAPALAFYNVVYGTATLPRSVIAKFLMAIFVPVFANHRAPAARSHVARQWCLSLAAVASACAFGLAALDEPLLGAVFGDAYRPSRLFVTLAGLSLFLKLTMLIVAPAAYADGRTRLVTIASTLSALAVLPAAAALVWGRDLHLFLLALVVAEALVAVGFTVHTRTCLGVGRPLLAVAFGLPAAACTALALLAWAMPGIGPLAWFAGIATAGLMLLLVFGTLALRTRERAPNDADALIPTETVTP